MAGDFFAFEEFVTSAKMNKLADNVFTGIAQNAYQTLQANNVFENKDFLAADEFTDADGTNDTVNTGSSTATYNSSQTRYELSSTVGTPEAATAVSAPETGSTGNISTTMSIANSGFISTIRFVNATNNTGDTFTFNIIRGSTTLASVTAAGGNSGTTGTATFTISDYDSILASGDTITVQSVYTGGVCYNKTGQTYSGTDFSYTSQNVPATNSGSVVPFEFTDASYSTSGTETVLSDTDTLTLGGTEEFITVYGDKSVPTNTTLTVDVSDGSTTLSAQALDEAIDVSSLSTGTLELTFNLASSNGASTPFIKGWGVVLK